MKPFQFKNYGSIGHLPESRLGDGDHHINSKQAEILTSKTRDHKDLIIVQEKVDGANVGVYRDEEGQLHALTRKGHYCADSDLEQFKMFQKYVETFKDEYGFLLKGERLVGEWLAMAHGTRYDMTIRDPFVAFDIMKGSERLPYIDFRARVRDSVCVAKLLHIGQPISVKKVEKLLGEFGHHGAKETAEGAVWRVERDGKVDFLAKYVRHGKEDGKYFNDLVWNWRPEWIID